MGENICFFILFLILIAFTKKKYGFTNENESEVSQGKIVTDTPCSEFTVLGLCLYLRLHRFLTLVFM